MTDQDILMNCHRDLDLPICCPTGGVLVYRWATETLYAVSGGVGARTVTDWREVSARAAGPLLATLTRTGAITGFGAEEDAYLQSLATLTTPAARPKRRRAKKGAVGASANERVAAIHAAGRGDIPSGPMTTIVCRVCSPIIAPIVARPGELLVIRPAAADSLAVTDAVGKTELRRAQVPPGRLHGDLRRLLDDEAIWPLTSLDERLLPSACGWPVAIS